MLFVDLVALLVGGLEMSFKSSQIIQSKFQLFFSELKIQKNVSVGTIIA